MMKVSNNDIRPTNGMITLTFQDQLSKESKMYEDNVPNTNRRQWSGCILSAVDWSVVNESVKREQKNRERYAPVVSVYRWWARRPHRLIGALLDAARTVSRSTTIKVADPFSGGGTVAFEAARRRMPVYAQDLYPWPTIGLTVGLTSVSSQELEQAGKDLLSLLEPLREEFRRPDGRELTHVLRVRVGTCPQCTQRVYLFPQPLVSVASRSNTEIWAYYGCRACGGVQCGFREQPPTHCTACTHVYETVKERGIFTCPHCGHSAVQRNFMQDPPQWHPLLVQEAVRIQGRLRAWLRPVEPEDPIDSPAASIYFPEMRNPIPPGIETRRLLEAGFRTWGDLYTVRQAKIILHALRNIHQLDASDTCKERLALAVIGAGEMPAFLSRWDRYHLKAFEGIANHRYAHTTVVVEMNPLGVLGRGTLIRRIKATRIASEWVAREIGALVRPKYITKINRQVDLQKGVYIATGSSERQALKNGTVDLVLTDPPYYDDVQYGELARIFHFWLSMYCYVPAFDEGEEAVPNSSRHRDAKTYEEAVSRCLAESKRTLVPGGRLILTFHNRKMVAWRALCAALWRSGFEVCALAVARAENDADHTKRGGKGLLHDLVLECVRREEVETDTLLEFCGHSNEEKILLSMGRALSKALRQGRPEDLPKLFQDELEKMGIKNECIR